MRETTTVTGQGVLKIAGSRFEFTVTVPADPVSLKQMLPIFQALTDQLVNIAIHGATAAGKQISCASGCGACCRQLVPLSAPEVSALQDFLSTLPGARQLLLRQRFRAARERLAAAGLLPVLQQTPELTAADWNQLGLTYFQEEIACPFLEQEACSIYEHRPLACREYLVTSPARHCARPDPQTVTCLPLPANPGEILRQISSPEHRTRWHPLILLLETEGETPEADVLRTGPEWLDLFLGKLAPGRE